MCQRQFIFYCIINCINCIDIIYHTVYICRQHGRIYHSACRCINKRTLTTLRIFCIYSFYFNIRVPLDCFLYLCHSIPFIVFYGNNCLCFFKKRNRYFCTLYNQLRCFYHSSVIRSKIWFTFCTIYNIVLYIVGIFWRKLYAGWKTCTSHTDNSGFFN